MGRRLKEVDMSVDTRPDRRTLGVKPAPPSLQRAQHRPPFEQTVLLLQGGGALGSYQAGVYQALAETGLHPDWVVGVSIGAVNAALIVGNPPEQRVQRLREFWETVSTPPLGSFSIPHFASVEISDAVTHSLLNQVRALEIALLGAPGFFRPRLPSPWLFPFFGFEALSHYDVAPLRETVERLVDFKRINAGYTRFSVGAVNVRSGNLTYFDNTLHEIGLAHVIASGSLPPGFPATNIDGEYYWDGGIVSNTPLQWAVDSRPRKDTLAFQVDLWNARGALPRDLTEVDVREREIRFSSRTRQGTDRYKYEQKLRRAAANLLKHLPEEMKDDPDFKLLEQVADDKVCNLVHLIYRSKSYEGIAKDYEFSRRTMEEHWKSGYDDAVASLRHPEVLQRPDNPEGIRIFDLGNVEEK
jgi:NTE family protein